MALDVDHPLITSSYVLFSLICCFTHLCFLEYVCDERAAYYFCEDRIDGPFCIFCLGPFPLKTHTNKHDHRQTENDNDSIRMSNNCLWMYIQLYPSLNYVYDLLLLFVMLVNKGMFESSKPLLSYFQELVPEQ